MLLLQPTTKAAAAHGPTCCSPTCYSYGPACYYGPATKAAAAHGPTCCSPTCYSYGPTYYYGPATKAAAARGPTCCSPTCYSYGPTCYYGSASSTWHDQIRLKVLRSRSCSTMRGRLCPCRILQLVGTRN